MMSGKWFRRQVDEISMLGRYEKFRAQCTLRGGREGAVVGSVGFAELALEL